MIQGGMVFPLPSRYFDDMIDACINLASYYGQNPCNIRPLYVVTMKRSYIFESSAGAYGEFEPGGRFLYFGCSGGGLTEAGLFCGSFPGDGILREVQWEGGSFLLGVVPLDSALAETFDAKFAGIDWSCDRSETDWAVVQSFHHYVSHSHSQGGAGMMA